MCTSKRFTIESKFIIRNRKVRRPPLLEKINFIDNWMYKTRKSKRLIVNNRQYNVTVSDKDRSSDKTKTIPSITKTKTKNEIEIN